MRSSFILDPLPQFTFASRRTPVFSREGMVAASQPMAAAAGVQTLAHGGNAADAAIATAAALAVTEPCSTGLGGDAFALYYDAATRSIHGLNGSGRSPAGLTPELLRQKNMTELPAFHALTVTVPGACALWCDLQQRFGILTMEQVLHPAVRLARQGFSVGPVTSRLWRNGAANQLKDKVNAGELLQKNGCAPLHGECRTTPTLADVLETIAQGGKQAFYQGWPAQRIARAVQDAGGVLSEADLADHGSRAPDWNAPVSTVFRDLRIYECAPNGQGLAALVALNVLTALEDAYSGPALSLRRMHCAVEALRLGFSAARNHVADPEHHNIPIAELLSPAYARELASRITMKRCLPLGLGTPLTSSDTVYFCVVDVWGNACSMVNSNYMGFGTGIVPRGCGFSMQNRGHNFVFQEGHPNRLGPGKRPFHTIIPAMALDKSGDLFAAFGVMGGFMQPQGHVQVLEHMLEHGLDPQATLDVPRFCLTGDLQHPGDKSETGLRIALEEGVPQTTADALKNLGHNLVYVTGYERTLFGRGQIIVRDPASGMLCAGSDPRADGLAAPLV